MVSLRDQMTTLRAFLLQHIDHILGTASLPTDALTESMCALALVKTSSSLDLLRHFLNIRSNAISTVLDSSTSDFSAVHDILKLFHSTLLYTEVIFPKRIFEVLHQLKSKPLFENTELRKTPGLNINVNERWLPEDIRGFVPWVRHDELEDGRVHDSVKAWASRELEVLNGTIKRALNQIDDIGVIVSLRREILDSFHGSKSRLLHVVIGTQEPIQRIREQVNARLVELLDVNANTLERIGESIENFAQQNHQKDSGKRRHLSDNTPKLPDAINLWSDNLLGLPLSNGAALFRRTVQAAIVGHDAAMRFVSNEYQTWNRLIIATFGLLKGISKAEERDEFEDDGDIFGLGSNDAQDGVKDSEKVQKSLCLSLRSAYKSLEGRLERLVQACEEDPSNPRIASRSAFLLRAIRYLRQELHISAALDQGTNFGWFAKPLTIRLQRIVTVGFSSHALALFQRALHRRRWGKNCPSLPLWDGSPSPLPILPSPDVFKFLHELVLIMAKAGSDTWTPATVGHLRSVVKLKIWMIVDTEMNCRGVKATEKVGVGDNDPMPGGAGDGSVQSLGCDHIQMKRDEVESRGEEGKDATEKQEEQPYVSENPATIAEGLSFPSGPTPPLPLKNHTISRSWAIQLLYDLLYLLKFALPEDSTSPKEDRLSRLKVCIPTHIRFFPIFEMSKLTVHRHVSMLMMMNFRG